MNKFSFNKHFLKVEIEGVRYLSLEGLGQEKISALLIGLGESLKETGEANMVETLKTEAKRTIDAIFGEGSYEMIFKSVDDDLFNLIALVEFLSEAVQKTTGEKLNNLKEKYAPLTDLKDAE